MIPVSIMMIESDIDRAYMTALYQKHYPIMYVMAMRYTDQLADAEDIVSASCVALIKHIDTIRPMAPAVLKTYILTTTRNTAISYVRQKNCRDKHIILKDDEELFRIPVEAIAEKRIVLIEQVEATLRAIEALPDRDQDVLRMKFQEHVSDSGIAAHLGISEAAVRKALERARKRLKSLLIEE